MKKIAIVLFYCGIIAALLGAALITYGILAPSSLWEVVGVFTLVSTIIFEAIAMRLALRIDAKENPVETKEEGKKPH